MKKGGNWAAEMGMGSRRQRDNFTASCIWANVKFNIATQNSIAYAIFPTSALLPLLSVDQAAGLKQET